MLVVTGASGQLGNAVVQRLLERVPVGEIGVSLRDPGKALALTKAGVRVRHGDFAKPETLADAFDGADRILIVSSNAAAHGGDTLAQHRSAIAAACNAGARRIFYTSHVAASPASAFPPCRDHAATEAMLAGCGVAWTALRHGFYAESAPIFLRDWRTSGIVSAPADGPVAWTTHADLAEADALLLTAGDAPDGPTPPLTGSEALDLAAVAELAGRLADTPVRRAIVPDAQLAEMFAERGAPPAAVSIALGFYQAARSLEFAAVDPALATLLGRAPQTMRDVLAAQQA